MTYGKDLPQARVMAADAIGGYIKSLKKHGEPVPTDDTSFFTSVDVDLTKQAHYA